MNFQRDTMLRYTSPKDSRGEDRSGFPYKGKGVVFGGKTQAWRLKSDPNIVIQSDYSFIADGVKLTQEVADFLKGTGRDPRRYDK